MAEDNLDIDTWGFPALHEYAEVEWGRSPYQPLDEDATLDEKLTQIADEMERCAGKSVDEQHKWADYGLRKALYVLAQEHSEDVEESLQQLARLQDELSVYFA